MDIFERAARNATRFNCRSGILTVEDLFGLNLEETRSNKLSLDLVAQDVDKQLKDLGAVSFVSPKPNAKRSDLELQWEIIKYIIASKQNDAAAAEKRAQTIETKKKLVEALASKQADAIKNLSEEELQARIAALEG